MGEGVFAAEGWMDGRKYLSVTMCVSCLLFLRISIVALSAVWRATWKRYPMGWSNDGSTLFVLVY